MNIPHAQGIEVVCINEDHSIVIFQQRNKNGFEREEIFPDS